MSLKDFMPMQERCSNCSFCKWIPFDKVKSGRFAENCPAGCWGNWNTYFARGRFQMGLAIVNEEFDYNDVNTKIVHSCMDCGACDVSCKVCRYNLEPLEHNRELKHDAISKGHVLPEQRALADSYAKEHTMIRGAKNADRTNWAKEIKWADKPEALFFPGCKYSYDENLWDNAKFMVNLIQKSGVALGYLGEKDACCGSRMYQMGFFEEFDFGAKANIDNIQAMGIKTIITPCADCYYALKRLYVARGLDVEVLHIVEFLDRQITEGKLTFTKAVNKVVTYHDPCHLARQGEAYEAWNGHEKKILNQIHTWEPRRPRYNGAKGIYDASRDILAAIPGITLVEMERIKEYAWCCGAGAAVNETNPELSKWTASERVTEAKATGAEVLVTACPWCESNFIGTADENGETINVLDIIDLVKEAL